MRYYDQQYRTDRYGRPPWPPRRRPMYGSDFDDRRLRPRTPRVTAPYNRDYVLPRPTPPRFNPNPFVGDIRGRMVDLGAIREPYITRGGTWTSRGSLQPRYDSADYRPNYGGRYPDEF